MFTILLIIAAGLLILNLILFFDVRAHDRRLGELGNSAARADQNLDTRITGLNRRLADVEEQVGNTTDYCTTNELHNDDVGETLESNARDIEALRERVESVEEVCATRKMVEGLREKLDDVEESMTLLAHEATVDRGRVFTMSNKLDAISRAQAPTSNREIEDSINDVAGKLDKTDFLVFQIAQRLQGLNELENKVDRLSKAFNVGGTMGLREMVKLLKDNFDQERKHSDDVAEKLKAQIEKVNRRVGHCEDINAKRQQHNSQQRDKCHQKILNLADRLTKVEDILGRPPMEQIHNYPGGAFAVYKTDGTIITTYPDGTVETSRPCKDDKVNDKVYSVWDDRPEAPPGYEIIKRVQLDTNGKCIYLMQRTNPGAIQ